MKHKRQGFTLVEIALFLAITGLLFVGIIAGTNNSIFQQRFNDSVQNYAEFLRSIYSEVSNPQSVGEGRSEYAIYGKLVSFGQTYDINGNSLNGEQRVYVYDVVGDATGTGSGDALELLKDRKATVAVIGANGVVSPAGIIETYYPRWGSSIEKKDNNALDNADNVYKGSILVIRHPRSGTINTLVSDKVIEVNQKIRTANQAGTQEEKKLLVSEILLGVAAGETQPVINSFTTQTVDFCMNPYGVERASDWRRDIRLVSNARNASGVEVIDMDLDLKNSDGEQTGNRCRFK